jgi:hypothetical protein
MTRPLLGAMRSHACGSLRAGDAGTEVRLAGWVAHRRDHGGVAFLDLRDASGLVQVVVRPRRGPGRGRHPERGLRPGRGHGQGPPAGNENPELPTGEVEVAASGVEVLAPSETPPFPLGGRAEADETLRLQYRYRDLRRPAARRGLEIRAQANATLRRVLADRGFLEVETPYLTKSTPEGARDFLVTTHLAPGQFYALPQSPQLFKQLLMVAGVERYYQIVRCFRDEALRADRRPEFTQLDLELWFLDEEDVYGLGEELMAAVWRERNRDRHLRRRPAGRPAAAGRRPRPGPRGPLGVPVGDRVPMFEWDEQAGRWDPAHHPFTAPAPKWADTFTDAPQEAEDRFGFFLKGFAFGLDRIYMLMAGTPSIRDVITFSKTQSGADPFTGAPTPIPPDQLAEVRLRPLDPPGSRRIGDDGRPGWSGCRGRGAVVQCGPRQRPTLLVAGFRLRQHFDVGDRTHGRGRHPASAAGTGNGRGGPHLFPREQVQTSTGHGTRGALPQGPVRHVRRRAGRCAPAAASDRRRPGAGRRSPTTRSCRPRPVARSPHGPPPGRRGWSRRP